MKRIQKRSRRKKMIIRPSNGDVIVFQGCAFKDSRFGSFAIVYSPILRHRVAVPVTQEAKTIKQIIEDICNDMCLGNDLELKSSSCLGEIHRCGWSSETLRQRKDATHLMVQATFKFSTEDGLSFSLMEVPIPDGGEEIESVRTNTVSGNLAWPFRFMVYK